MRKTSNTAAPASNHHNVIRSLASPLIWSSTHSSVITLKPAIRYQFKTGQRDWPKT
jgi:hypothetical protein